jgi:hypothetical protein
VCGADLEAARGARAARRLAVPSVSVGRRLPPDWWIVPVVGLLALVVPVFGLLIAALAIYRRDSAADYGMRNAFIAVAALAVVILIIPPLRFGVLSLLFG